MARPKASQSASGGPLVAERSKSGRRKKTSQALSPEVLGISNIIVLDSEDDTEQTTFKPCPSQFGSSRDLGKTTFSMIDQKSMLSPRSSESRKMKDSRKRVLAVEDPSGPSRFDSKCFRAFPTSVKRSALGVSLDGKCPLSDTRKTVERTVDLNVTKQSFKAKGKLKGGVKAGLEMQFGTPEHVEQDNKENNGSDIQEGNGMKNENSGKKRKKEADSSVDPESSSKRSQLLPDLAAGGSVSSEGKIMSRCHQCRQNFDSSLVWCRNMSGKRACTQKYCAKCLHNRYGEIVAQVDQNMWNCPRCRDICNCSLCMKKKGLAPTGGLAKKAKAAGYSSVADLLEKFPNMHEERYTREESGAVTSDIKSVMPIKHDGVVQLVDEGEMFQTSESEKKSKQVNEDTKATESFRPGGDQSEGGKKRRRKKSGLDSQVDHAQGQRSAAELEKDVVGESSTRKKKQRKSRAKVRVGQDLVREDLVDDSAVEAYEEEEEIVLPTGASLMKVGNLDFPPEAVGPALQIMEFCSAFEKPLNLKRARAQRVLSESLREGTLRRGGQSELVQLHVQLLSIILDDVDDDTTIAMSGASKNCWVYHLERHLTEQYSLLKKAVERHGGEEDDGERSVSAPVSGAKSLPLTLWPVSGEDMMVIVKALRSGLDGYGSLSITTRLQLLATLCDDTLTTKKMRDYLDKAISSREVEQKENREERLALKKQAKEIHEDDAKEVMAAKRYYVVPLVRDLARVKREYAKLAEKEAQLTETAAKLCGPRCDALRSEAAAVHKSGSRFWRLKGAKDREVVVLQGITILERDLPNEAWSVFSEDQEEEVLQCITNLNTRKKAPVRSTRQRRKRKDLVQVDCKHLTTIESKSPEIPIIELSD